MTDTPNHNNHSGEAPSGAPVPPCGYEGAQAPQASQTPQTSQVTPTPQAPEVPPVPQAQQAASCSQPGSAPQASSAPQAPQMPDPACASQEPQGSCAAHAPSAPQAPVVPAMPNSQSASSIGAEASTVQTQACKSHKPGKRHGLGALGLGALGGALACSFILGVFGITGMFDRGGYAPAGSSAPIEVKGDSPQLAEAVAQRALPSVVAIDIYTNQSKQNPFKSLQGHDKFEKTSLGSGVIISKDGYILTNNHVIAGADKCTVTLQSGKQYEAKLVGADPSSDLAVIKVDAQNLDAIEVGNSSNLKVGEWVMSIGSPFGLEQSVASGIVSATSRSAAIKNQDGVSFYTNMIQTDAAINPGNSGGALVDDHARLIGINTMIQSETGNWSGVGFAIPVDYAISVAHDLMAGKQPSHAQLGLTASTVTSQIAQANGLSVEDGAYVISVIDGSPAAQAGIKPGDIITSFDGRPVESVSALILNIRAHNAGDKVEIGYVRAGKQEKVQVTLGSDSGKLQTGSPQPESFGTN